MRDFFYSHLNKIKRYDYSTYQHCLRVAQLSMFIGECIGLNSVDKYNLRHAALLHDIGKIMVPIFVLNKGGPLSCSKWELIHTHPENGRRILKRDLVPAREVVAGIISHNEHFDGAGYPAGSKGEDIPIFRRIIPVADTLDAMITPRCYRPVPVPFNDNQRNRE